MQVRIVVLSVLAFLALASAGAAETCGKEGGLGISRIVEIDAAGGPLFGDFTHRIKEPSFLGPKEVVLTFDDGPLPTVTRSILDTLDRFCTKATFFSVGRMAIAYPSMVREVLTRGHTVGAHTWSHPLNLPRLKPEKAHDEIERGFAAVALAAGQPIAPFFRFTGLADSDPLLAYLQTRGVASFTVDVVSDDSYIGDPGRLAQVTLQRIEARQGGIVLFHDIKVATAKALPAILSELRARGYKVVHMRASAPLRPLETYTSALVPLLVRSERHAPASSIEARVPSGTAAQRGTAPPVAHLAPAKRHRDEHVTPAGAGWPARIRRARRTAFWCAPAAA
jgi:peptidoglycan/xylan/chitin deacetylase (PgdA/CDA1 family)